MCKFCSNFDFGRIGIGYERGRPYTFAPRTVGDLAPESKFQFCPVCGKNLIESTQKPMRYKVGTVVKVIRVFSGGNFVAGDVVEITRIGDVDGEDMRCYGAISPHDGQLWYLQDDEIEALTVTRGDHIRQMNNDKLASFLDSIAAYMSHECDYPSDKYSLKLLEGILRTALSDYFRVCNRPESAISELLEDSIWKESYTLVDRIIALFSGCRVLGETDTYVNGFSADLLSQSHEDLNSPIFRLSPEGSKI